MAGHIAAQDAASHALVTGLGRELAELDSWFERLGRSGGAQSERLGQSVATVRAAAGELLRELGAGQAQASELNERAGHLGHGPGRHFVGAQGGSPGGAREFRGAGGARPRSRAGDRAGRR
jgi:hypothetical protein